MPAPLICDVVTVDRMIYTGEVTSAVVPGHDGEMAFLNMRAPIMIALKQGEVRVTSAEGTVSRFLISGGYAQMSNGNKVIVLAEHAVAAGNIDLEALAAKDAELQSSLDAMEADDANMPWVKDQLDWCKAQEKYAAK